MRKYLLYIFNYVIVRLNMKKKKIVGMEINTFNDLIENGHIHVRKAKLIPPTITKSGNELALTSVFLSALRLIKEFRSDIFSEIKFKKPGSHYYYTEVSFSKDKNAPRPDGLLLNVVSNKIQDAVLIEVKNGKNDLKPAQIQSYIDLSKDIGIHKILTISNQFVGESSQTPCSGLKLHKGFELYHLSWSYILTIAKILLFKNDHNILDEDQIQLMHEIVDFFEAEESGVLEFSQMETEWQEVSKSIKLTRIPHATDKSLIKAIKNWQEEEKNMILLLSRKLGLLVRTTSKLDQDARLHSDTNSLRTKHQLSTKLKITGSVSDLEIIINFMAETITMKVALTAPAPPKTVRGQIGWLRKQFDKCSSKNEKIYQKLEKELYFQALLKYKATHQLTEVSGIDSVVELLKDKEIKGFEVSYMKAIGEKFGNRKEFIKTIESMLFDFYSIIQYLENAPQKSPQIEPPEEDEVIPRNE